MVCVCKATRTSLGSTSFFVSLPLLCLPVHPMEDPYLFLLCLWSRAIDKHVTCALGGKLSSYLSAIRFSFCPYLLFLSLVSGLNYSVFKSAVPRLENKKPYSLVFFPLPPCRLLVLSPPCPQMKITFRLSTETSFSVTVPDNSGVEDLRNSVKVGCPPGVKLPADYKLIYNGQKLTPLYKPLEEFGMAATGNYTVILMSDASDTPVASPRLAPTTVSAPKKKAKKNRCLFQSCTLAPLRMVGDCSHCHGKFCAKHRLLEDHLCTGLQFCKESAHERNATKLQSESTIVSRV